MDQTSQSSEISLKEIANKVRNGVKYIRLKSLSILIFGIIGSFLGLTYSILKKPIYTAVCTFVLEESGKSALGQYAGLASLAGIDLGGGGSSGIFQADNIIELYKSRLMLQKTLLSPVTVDGKNQLLIDRYIQFNDLKNKWKENDINNVSFTGNPEYFTRTQDSIMSSIVELFNKDLLRVDKLDKKLSIIEVQVVSKDELFAKMFNLKLVETVNNFYTLTKTKKSNQNVTVLQRQADSVKMVLNTSLSGVASAIDANPNANPLLLALRVPSQKKQIDVQASTAIYAEIVKNLELAKISLRQDIPLIQIIDKPVLPLLKSKVGKLKGIILGGLLGAFFCIAYILVQKAYATLMK